jgi:hypothetical protein
MNARSLAAPLLFSLSIAGCATEPEVADVAQIGPHIVTAQSTRVEAEPPAWSTVEARLAELGIQNVAGILEFAPDEGRYGFAQKLVRTDECGIAEGSVAVDHDILSVNAKSGTYTDNFVARGEQEPQLAVGCELSDHTYRCNSSTTTIDFSVLGLAAKVTIQNDAFGIWSGADPAFVGAFPYSLSCKGADCNKPPASNLFGVISRSMPCTGLQVAQFKK